MPRRAVLLLFLALTAGGSAGARATTAAPQYGPLIDIFTINADGTGRTNLTNNYEEEHSPAWSPDGRKIVYVNGDANRSIWVMNADGSGQRAVTLISDGHIGDGSPTWSPDGTKIAFTVQVINEIDIFVMNADGSGQTNVTNRPEDELSPDWSPECSTILF